MHFLICYKSADIPVTETFPCDHLILWVLQSCVYGDASAFVLRLFFEILVFHTANIYFFSILRINVYFWEGIFAFNPFFPLGVFTTANHCHLWHPDTAWTLCKIGIFNSGNQSTFPEANLLNQVLCLVQPTDLLLVCWVLCSFWHSQKDCAERGNHVWVWLCCELRISEISSICCLWREKDTWGREERCQRSEWQDPQKNWIIVLVTPFY